MINCVYIDLLINNLVMIFQHLINRLINITIMINCVYIDLLINNLVMIFQHLINRFIHLFIYSFIYSIDTLTQMSCGANNTSFSFFFLFWPKRIPPKIIKCYRNTNTWVDLSMTKLHTDKSILMSLCIIVMHII